VTARTWSSPYDSHLAFYQDTYGQHLVETHALGRIGSTMFVSEQSAGDWSDAPVPDLVITRLLTTPVPLTMDISAGRKWVKMERGEFIIVPPGFATTFLIDGPHRIDFIAMPYRRLLHLAGGPEESGLPTDGDFGQLHASFHADPQTIQIMDRLWRETRSGNPHGALGADGLILQLLGALLRLRDSRPVSSPRGGLAAYQLRRVCAYLEDHLAEDVSVTELAALVGLSPSHFCRAFAVSTGAPPHRWLMARRIERGRELLLATPLTITDVSLACGFASSQHFAASFRNALGLSPTEYRRERLR
jgi:AraC family transcriptional regulator